MTALRDGTAASTRVDFSLVIPLHNEEANVPRLIETVTASLETNPLVARFQIVCVNDGSTDRTGLLLEERRSERITVVTLPRRRGQSAGLARGILAARYDVLGRMDGDLQTSPDDFAVLLPWLERGFDCAHGVRAERHDTMVRRLSSRVARVVRRAWVGDHFDDISCPLTVFRKECVSGLTFFDSIHRYLPLLIELQGYRVAQVPVRHFPRLAGRSKYGIANRIGIGVESLYVMRWMSRHIIPRQGPGAAAERRGG